MNRPPTPPPPLLRVRHLGLASKHAPVFSDVSFDLAPHTLGVVQGASGSGRSSLLLATAGRMRDLTGHGTCAGHDLVRASAAIRSRTAVARLADLVDLEPQLTVGESLVERSLTEGISTPAAESALTAIEGLFGVTFPRRALVEDLSRLDRGRLALALAALRPAELIIFDDVDRDLDPTDQHQLYAAMLLIAATGCAVLASTTTAETIPSAATVVALDPRTASPQEM